MPSSINNPTGTGSGQSYPYHHTPSEPAVKPDDPDMMNFIALDDIQISKDELKRQKLAGKRREFLKTDLTWKHVLLCKDKLDHSQSLGKFANIMGYEYVCIAGIVWHLVEVVAAPTKPLQLVFEATGLVEDDINEIL